MESSNESFSNKLKDPSDTDRHIQHISEEEECHYGVYTSTSVPIATAHPYKDPVKDLFIPAQSTSFLLTFSIIPHITIFHAKK